MGSSPFLNVNGILTCFLPAAIHVQRRWMVHKVRLELTHPGRAQVLSLLRIPFRHLCFPDPGPVRKSRSCPVESDRAPVRGLRRPFPG